jgi:multiple sugar transport system ATP-binding protein
VGEGGRIPLAADFPVSEGRSLTVGIRPEHIRIGAADGEGQRTTIDLVEPTGFGTIVHVRLFGLPMKVFTLDRGVAKPGTAVTVDLDPGRLHLFDGETGVRLN